MNLFGLKNKWTQGGLGVIIIGITTLFCFYFISIVSYKIVALLLLMEVSIMAAIFSLPVVVFLAVMSAFVWNFFFIPPLYTFQIQDTEDALLFIMYFIVALANGVLYVKIRSLEKRNRDKLEKEKLIKLYNTLLNSLSHEMRTPITTILSSVDLMKDEIDLNHNKSLLEYALQIEIAGLRLNLEVDNLLNMSRLDSGMLQLKQEWCDLQDLINGVLNRIQLKEYQKVKIEIDQKFPIVKLDQNLFSHVFINLISNSLRHGGETAEILITINYDGVNLIVDVEDNGLGFVESEIPFVFNKFTSGTKTKQKGLGLGLSIVKGIVESYNGSIIAKNRINGGALVHFEIPIEVSPISIN